MEGGEEASTRETCQFYIVGKCRFGEDCRNLHPAGLGVNNVTTKSTSKKASAKREEQKVTKRGMKTAMDVIK